jgi:hypothetical protein
LVGRIGEDAENLIFEVLASQENDVRIIAVAIGAEQLESSRCKQK